MLRNKPLSCHEPKIGVSMFKYNYVADLFLRIIKDIDYPMQVELHPGGHCGPMNCRYCYGKNQKLNLGELNIDEYTKLLDEINGRTNLIDISGIASDPLSYKYLFELIDLLKQKGCHFGIHTKGYFLTSELSKLINSGRTEGDFITISIDSANKNKYNNLHGIRKNVSAFDKILENVRYLKSVKDKNNSKIRINFGYLLFEENSNPEDIEEFIHIFEPLGDVLRFSIPQVPNVAKPSGFICQEDIDNKLSMLKKYEKDNIVVLKFSYSQHDNSFDTCWSQRFNMTIDKAGNVYPCPQVASSQYNHLRYGNIKLQTLFEIWNSQKRNEIIGMSVDREMKCRVCDRKDENINIELEKILNPEKYILNEK